MELSVAVETDARAVVAGVQGEIDLSNASELERRLLETLDGGSPLVVDLTQVAYLDSSALACLHRVSLAAADRDVPMLVVTGDHGMAKRLLAITGLDQVLRPYTTLTEAMAWLSSDQRRQ
jgi:anti-anti-sigma factor